jgi:FkbM family methyltransferase
LAKTRDRFDLYLRVRPITTRGALRLYLGFAAALLSKITRLKRRIGVIPGPGAFVLGESLLGIRVDGVFAMVRPRTTDLVIMTRLHEPLAASWFGAHANETVIDVGAHIGCYSLRAARDGARVIAIEPDPANFNLLRGNVRMNGFTNVVSLNFAASDRRGWVPFFGHSGENTGTSSLEPDWTHPTRNEDLGKVECRTLDEIVTSYHIERIDWLKIDVEGHEVHTLLGGPKALSLTANLMIEVSKENTADCIRLIEESGLEVEAVERGEEVSNWFCSRRRRRVAR